MSVFGLTVLPGSIPGPVVGAGLYGVSYLLPQFLGNVSGYNAQQAGSIMLLSGVPAFLLIPFLPRLLARYGHQRENVVMLSDIQASAERAALLTRQRYRAYTASTLDCSTPNVPL